ncbi:Flp family type IVb pilin [Vibrio brasiliensis]|jgi:pilus assembly protein Flp/PilA|uniref:Flp family type IVb pilin n=1 Tax=Vibrio brasiliensis TaxID=170652 RepID=UPI001EFCD305|nr:Flp family type IVb pilin [Vibrio brasiliensis]MCG9748891.1 Flp family type IVb pilin [Vibrio brasiliensis]MCG9782154.1 Flp family type IVb pilin [Vibrio brasiliensis]
MITKLFVKAQLVLENYKNDEQGVTAIEYGLIAAGVAVAVGTAAATLGTDLTTIFTKISNALKAA